MLRAKPTCWTTVLHVWQAICCEQIEVLPMSVLVTIKCPCSSCSERIEYPPDMCGRQITCPHCQQTTMLLAPQISPEALTAAPVPAAPQSATGGPHPPQLDGSTNKNVRIVQSALVPAPPGPGAPPPAPPGPSTPPPTPRCPGAPPPPSAGKPTEDDPYATMKTETPASPTPPAKGGGAPPPPPPP